MCQEKHNLAMLLSNGQLACGWDRNGRTHIPADGSTASSGQNSRHLPHDRRGGCELPALGPLAPWKQIRVPSFWFLQDTVVGAKGFECALDAQAPWGLLYPPGA